MNLKSGTKDKEQELVLEIQKEFVYYPKIGYYVNIGHDKF
jgi:hypothetical protein